MISSSTQTVFLNELQAIVFAMDSCLQLDLPGSRIESRLVSPSQGQIRINRESEDEMRIRVLQMDQMIVVFLGRVGKQGGSTDRLFFKWKQFLRPKLNNCYSPMSLKNQPAMRTFLSLRTKKCLRKPNPDLIPRSAICNNFILISSFLRWDDICSVCLLSTHFKDSLLSQSRFKIIYEIKWGKTGFKLESMDWIRQFKKKEMEKQAVKVVHSIFSV